MAWAPVKLERRQGIGAGRPTAAVRVSLHRNGPRSSSLRFSVALETVRKIGLKDATGVHLEVDRAAGLFRLAFRVSGPARLRPGHGNSKSWHMSCVHRGEMSRIFPADMFHQDGKNRTLGLTLVEASSEGLTVRIPQEGGGAA